MTNSILSLDINDEIKKKISYEKRNLITNFIFISLVLVLYFGVFLGILLSILHKSMSIFLILYAIYFILLVAYILFRPSKFENFTFYLGDLANNLKGGPTKKGTIFRKILRELDKLSISKKGFNSILFNTLRDYFNNVLVYMVFSKRENAVAIIQSRLLEMSKCEDTHSIYESFIKLNNEIIHLDEFQNLLNVSLHFQKGFDMRELDNPFKWIPQLESSTKKDSWHNTKIILNYLDEKGVTKVILILFSVTIFGWILDKMGLLEWATRVIPNLL